MAMHRFEDWVPGVPGSAPRPDALADIERAAVICRDYARQGYDLTLRQLYYQFVSRGWIANEERQYKRLGDIVSRARMCGLLDWDWIVDRGRSLYGTPHKRSPAAAIQDQVWRYHIDKWRTQPTRVEVWVEKEALAGVVGRAAGAWDIDYFPCKGYASVSAAHEAGMRLQRYMLNGQNVVVLYLGDHDPSGIDMTRDVRDRLETFIGWRAASDLEVRRIALNRDQVDEYNPPPNPAKLTDSRAADYVAEHGYESWELDALDPATLDALIQQHIAGIVDMDRYEEMRDREESERDLLRRTSDRWDDVVSMLEAS